MSALFDRRFPFESERHFNRRMAKKYGLDFEHRCCFVGMIAHLGTPRIRDTYEPQRVRVAMYSGRNAEYVVQMGGYYNGTGQHDWTFTFQKYLTSPSPDKRIIP